MSFSDGWRCLVSWAAGSAARVSPIIFANLGYIIVWDTERTATLGVVGLTRSPLWKALDHRDGILCAFKFAVSFIALRPWHVQQYGAKVVLPSAYTSSCPEQFFFTPPGRPRKAVYPTHFHAPRTGFPCRWARERQRYPAHTPIYTRFPSARVLCLSLDRR